MLLAALTSYVCFTLKASKLLVFPYELTSLTFSVSYLWILSYIYIYVVRFTYFSVKKGGGGSELSFRFSVLLHHGLFCVFSVECFSLDDTGFTYAYSAFYITLRFLNQLVRATLDQLLGYACPDVKLRVSGLAVTDSARFLRWRIRFLSGIRVHSFDYSRVTRVRVLLTFLTTSLRYLRILASLGVTWCDPPTFLPTLTFSSRAVPFLGF